MKLHLVFRRALILFVLLTSTGCDSHPIGRVAGRVTLGDQPLAGASIVFEQPDTAVAVSANLADDGSYTIRTSEHNGLPPGDYTVAIRPGIIGDGDVMLVGSAAAATIARAPSIPAKYHMSRTSGLTATVVEGSNPSFDFHILP